jgi:hypothetical protein
LESVIEGMDLVDSRMYLLDLMPNRHHCCIQFTVESAFYQRDVVFKYHPLLLQVQRMGVGSLEPPMQIFDVSRRPRLEVYGLPLR